MPLSRKVKNRGRRKTAAESKKNEEKQDEAGDLEQEGMK